jgi:hypothetical protein
MCYPSTSERRTLMKAAAASAHLDVVEILLPPMSEALIG